MSDMYPGQIWIGGKISRTAKLFPADDDPTTVLQGLIQALAQDGASHNYGEPSIKPDCPEAVLLDEYMDDGDTLLLRDDQAHNGEFEATEQFCIDNDIPFDRNADHYCENDAELALWRPGMKRPFCRLANSNGDEIVCGSTVRKAMAAFEECRTRIPHTMKTDRFEAGVALLLAACPELPPDLEPFEIVA